MRHAYLRDIRDSDRFCSIGELGSPLKQGTMGFNMIQANADIQSLGRLYATLEEGSNEVRFFRIDSWEIRKCECGDVFMKVTWKEMV